MTESVTRSGWLELQDEERLMREGYEFLDEKRMILASEMLDRLRAQDALHAEVELGRADAARALARAVARHGIDDLRAAPAPLEGEFQAETTSRNLLGVQLVDGAAAWRPRAPAREPVEPTPELQTLAGAYTQLIPRLFELAVAQGTLLRMADEYERTERRARALENVLLPELREQLSFVEEQLEAMEREDVVRVRFRGQGGRAGED